MSHSFKFKTTSHILIKITQGNDEIRINILNVIISRKIILYLKQKKTIKIYQFLAEIRYEERNRLIKNSMYERQIKIIFCKMKYYAAVSIKANVCRVKKVEPPFTILKKQ